MSKNRNRGGFAPRNHLPGHLTQLGGGGSGLAIIELGSLEYAAKEIGLEIEYLALRQYMLARYNITQAITFTALNERAKTKVNNLYTLSEWMSFHGYTMRRRAGHLLPHGGERPANMDVDIAVMTLEQLHSRPGGLDRVVFFSGDRDLIPVVDVLKRHGVYVEVVGVTKGLRPGRSHLIARHLRQSANRFIELRDLLEAADAIKTKNLTVAEVSSETWVPDPAMTGDPEDELHEDSVAGDGVAVS